MLSYKMCIRDSGFSFDGVFHMVGGITCMIRLVMPLPVSYTHLSWLESSFIAICKDGVVIAALWWIIAPQKLSAFPYKSSR